MILYRPRRSWLIRLCQWLGLMPNSLSLEVVEKKGGLLFIVSVDECPPAMTWYSTDGLSDAGKRRLIKGVEAHLLKQWEAAAFQVKK